MLERPATECDGTLLSVLAIHGRANYYNNSWIWAAVWKMRFCRSLNQRSASTHSRWLVQHYVFLSVPQMWRGRSYRTRIPCHVQLYFLNHYCYSSVCAVIECLHRNEVDMRYVVWFQCNVEFWKLGRGCIESLINSTNSDFLSSISLNLIVWCYWGRMHYHGNLYLLIIIQSS